MWLINWSVFPLSELTSYAAAWYSYYLQNIFHLQFLIWVVCIIKLQLATQICHEQQGYNKPHKRQLTCGQQSVYIEQNLGQNLTKSLSFGLEQWKNNNVFKIKISGQDYFEVFTFFHS